MTNCSDDPSSLCTLHAYYLQGVSPERALLVGIFTFKQFLSLSEGLIDFAFQQTVLAVWIFHLASLNPKTDFGLLFFKIITNIRNYTLINCFYFEEYYNPQNGIIKLIVFTKKATELND